MTQEDKELLLKDLCARLPYGVKCRFEITIDKYKTIEFSREGTNGLLVDFDELYCYWFNEGFILPYLRPMSSMTEEEKGELHSIIDKETEIVCEQIETSDFGIDEGKYHFNSEQELDFCLRHHFDYRGLIQKGLAIVVTEENNPY